MKGENESRTLETDKKELKKQQDSSKNIQKI